MQCQSLFSGKNKKNIWKCRLLKILSRVQSVNSIPDGQPTFTSAASGDIDENTAAGTEIIQLVTTGVTGTVTYAIDSKNPNVDWFDIAVDKLKVKAGATVDYEDTALTSKIVTIVITYVDIFHFPF